MQIVKVLKPLVDRFPSLAQMYRISRDRQFLSETPKDTPMGFKFSGDPVMQQGLFETREWNVAVKCLEKVDVFINIGANIGYYCCLALKLGKYVFAFEAIDLNVQYLTKNISANKWDESIEIFPVALSNKVGLVDIYGGAKGASLVKGWMGIPEHYVRTIPTTTLDNILCDRLSGKQCFVLIDVEGAEKNVLEGATKHLLLKPKPIWMVEIATKEHQPQSIKINPNLIATFELFWRNGYECFTADGLFRRISKHEVVEVSETGHDNWSVHNFLFMDDSIANQIRNTL
ncbi:FkbM family methyltransferase [uncultured Nostoc sp.]|uniref:FkbM family methyltransferase n=1 Tax=uncultured Nostoc sp. TaxID=340711 RepID=UPI00260FB629|nr:FkbM family methyltransferase [uncultured Nostoc sp.]